MEDKSYYKKLFPLLNKYDLIHNSESELYNCISHTIGNKESSSWPNEICDYWPVKKELSISAFDDFYEYHGFEKVNVLNILYDKNYIKVALFTKNNLPTHASIQIDNHLWESKIGSLGIIRHNLFEIEGDIYGGVYAIYIGKS